MVIPRRLSRHDGSGARFALRPAASPPERDRSAQVQALSSQLARAERERDALAAANERLRSENIQLRAMDVALRDLLNFADECSHGQLRVVVEQAGEQLADWLSATID